VEKQQKLFDEISQSLAAFTATGAEKAEKEHGRALKKAWRDGLLPESAEKVAKQRESAVQATEKKYDRLKKLLAKMVSGDIGNIDDIGDRLAEMAASIGEGGNRALAKRLGKVVTAVKETANSGDNGIASLLSSLEEMEKEEILAINEVANGQLERLEKFSERTKTEIHKKHAAQEQRLKEDLMQAEERLNSAKELLNDRASWEFRRDTAEWLQKEDATFIHRNYDIGKILKYPDEFIADVSTNLAEIHGLLPDHASNVAHGLYNKLVNGGHSIGRFSSPALERGAVHGRDFEYATEVIRDWLVRDILANIGAVADVVIPDYHLMAEIGTFDGATLRQAFEKEANNLVSVRYHRYPCQRRRQVDGEETGWIILRGPGHRHRSLWQRPRRRWPGRQPAFPGRRSHGNRPNPGYRLRSSDRDGGRIRWYQAGRHHHRRGFRHWSGNGGGRWQWWHGKSNDGGR
jgi:hypothetical protein